MSYSAGIWGLKEYRCLNTLQNKAGRFLLSLPPKAPSCAIQGETGWNSMPYHTRQEVIRLFCRLNTMNDQRLTKKIWNWSNSISGSNCKNWAYNIKRFINKYDLDQIGVNSLSPKEGVVACRDILQNIENNQWSTKLWNDKGNANGNKLRTYRKFKSELCTEQYLNLNIPRTKRSPFVKLRCGVLPLQIELGRFQRIPIDQRICTQCDSGEVEDEMHFLMKYKKYRDRPDGTESQGYKQ